MIFAFTGQNDFLIKQNVVALQTDFEKKYGKHGVEKFDSDNLNPQGLAEILFATSLFSAQQFIVLHSPSQNKPLWEALGSWLEKVPTETILVIADSALDKRTKTYKQLAKCCQIKVCNLLSESELVAWLADKRQLDPGLAEHLVRRIGSNQWQLWNETEKLLNVANLDKRVVDQLTAPNPQLSAFIALEMIFSGRLSTVTEMLKDLAATEDPYRFFGLIVAQLQALAVVKTAPAAYGDEQIAKDAGIHPFVVKKTRVLARKVGKDQLYEMINALAVCDKHLKSTGAEPWFLIEQCLGKITNR